MFKIIKTKKYDKLVRSYREVETINSSLVNQLKDSKNRIICLIADREKASDELNRLRLVADELRSKLPVCKDCTDDVDSVDKQIVATKKKGKKQKTQK